MATLHLDRLPSRDQGRDGDKAIVMDRGVMRLCYKSGGEWYCSFPDVRKVKRDFSEMERIQWTGQTGVMVNALSLISGVLGSEKIPVYDLALAGAVMAASTASHNVLIPVSVVASAQVSGFVGIDREVVHDMALVGIIQSAATVAANLILSSSVSASANIMGSVGIDRSLVYELGLVGAVNAIATVTGKIIIPRSVSAVASVLGALGSEKVPVIDIGLVSTILASSTVSHKIVIPRSVNANALISGVLGMDPAKVYSFGLTSILQASAIATNVLIGQQAVSASAVIHGSIALGRTFINQAFAWKTYAYGGGEGTYGAFNGNTVWVSLYRDDNTEIGPRVSVAMTSASEYVYNSSAFTMTTTSSLFGQVSRIQVHDSQFGGSLIDNLNLVTTQGGGTGYSEYFAEDVYLRIPAGGLEISIQ